MLLSYCCQRDIKFIVAFGVGVWVGTCFEFVFCLFEAYDAGTMIVLFLSCLFFKRNQN